MKTNKHKRDAYLFDPVMEDGDPPLRVPVMLADSSIRLAGHRPGYATPLTADQARGRQAAFDARRQMIDRQREAGTVDDSNPRAPAIAARDAWVASLADAWRRPVPSPKPLQRLPGPDAGPPVRDAAKAVSGGPDKELAYEARNRALSEAWRSPGAGPQWVGPGAPA
jgi:hypothetical protein